MKKGDESQQYGQQQLFPIEAWMEELIKRNALVRLIAVKGKGVRLDIPCRILSYDPLREVVTCYHVDEKTVYSFRLNEIEDIVIR